MIPPSPIDYDAILLHSFGGPNAPEEVVPFLKNVTAGKGIPDERLAEVGEHYYAFGGKSPINEQNLALKAALETELRDRGIGLPIIWGNRNWAPYTRDAITELIDQGAKKVLVLITSAYVSYSGCRQYREDLAKAMISLGHTDLEKAPIEFDKLRAYFNHPGFAQANLEAINGGIEKLQAPNPHLVFVTHSIPDTMEEASKVGLPGGYSAQHQDLADYLSEELEKQHGKTFDYSLTYCSRSGPPSQPWLEPDVNDHLVELKNQGVSDVIIIPFGFVSDHMEVIYDLDTEALATAKDLSINAVRVPTVGTNPTFIKGIVDLIIERAAQRNDIEIEQPTVGKLGAFPAIAPSGSTLRQHGNYEGHPVLCSQDINS